MKAGESPPDQGRYGARPVPEARSRSQKSPRWSAARRCATRLVRIASLHKVRLAALRPLTIEGTFSGAALSSATSAHFGAANAEACLERDARKEREDAAEMER